MKEASSSSPVPSEPNIPDGTSGGTVQPESIPDHPLNLPESAPEEGMQGLGDGYEFSPN